MSRRREIERVRQYQDYPLVVKSLTQHSDFSKSFLEREVDRFYDLKSECVLMPRQPGYWKFELGIEDYSKIGEFPREMVNFLGGITEKNLDVSRLKYEDVRESCKYNSRPFRQGLRICSPLLGAYAMAVGVLYALGDPYVGVPMFVVAAVAMHNLRRYEGSAGEYIKMLELARGVDLSIHEFDRNESRRLSKLKELD